MKKIPIFFFTHSKYRIIFNEWKTIASLFLISSYVQSKILQIFLLHPDIIIEATSAFINSTSHEASPAITGGKSRPLEYGNDSFKRMRHGCNNWKKKKKRFAKVLNRRKNLHIQMRYTQIYISTYREAEKDDSILETVFYAQRHSRGA